MKLCKGLVCLAIAVAGLLPLARDTDAQQFCPRYYNGQTVTKQTTSTQMFQQAQLQTNTSRLQMQTQQANLSTSWQPQQVPVNRTTMQTKTTATPVQQTVTGFQPKVTQQIQQQTQVVNKTDMQIQHSGGMVCNKMSPQLMSTQTQVNKTNMAVSTTAMPTQCTFMQTKVTQQQIAHTDQSVQHTATPIAKTQMQVKKTDMAIMHTDMAVKKTPMQVTKTTTDTQYTIHINCMQCHHNAPTATAQTQQHQLPAMQHVQQAPLPQFVTKRPPGYPLLVQQPPLRLPPLMQLPPAEMPPLMAFKQPWLLPQAIAKQPLPLPQALPRQLPVELPIAKVLPRTMPVADLPALVRTPEKTKTKSEPLLVVAVADKKRPGGDTLPILVPDGVPDTGWRTASELTSQDLLGQMLPEQRRSQAESVTEFYIAPGDVEWSGLPTRPLPPGILALPAVPPEAEEVVDEEDVLPPLPRSASGAKTIDPGQPYQAAPVGPVQAAPATQQPQIDLQGLPRERLKELLPG
jgi:hypothetical protein